MILYVQTNNAATASGERGSENITDQDILRQISWIEGDDLTFDLGGYRSGLDRYKDDRGTMDGVVWVLSPAQIIKEANSSSYRFNCALERYALPTGQQESCTVASLNPYTGYSIPQGSGAQERIDEYVEIPAPSWNHSSGHRWGRSLGHGRRDNGDRLRHVGYGDSPRDDPKGITDVSPSGQIKDHKAFLSTPICSSTRSRGQRIVSSVTACTSPRRTRGTRRGLEVIPSREAVTITGLTPVLHDVSDAIYIGDGCHATTQPPLRWALDVRVTQERESRANLRHPIVMTLFITFGTIVITDRMLTPMIISAGPILVSVGVDYALHLTNRMREQGEDPGG